MAKNENLHAAKSAVNDDGNDICNREISGFYEGGAF